MWDGTESRSQKWRGCARGTGNLERDGNDCMTFGDRLSSSLVNQAQSFLFGAGGGVIFRPQYTKILCSYAGDGGSRHGGNDGNCGERGCDRGCGNPANMCTRERGQVDGWCDGAAHRPEDLDNMMRWWQINGKGYNEVIVDSAFHAAHLPDSVEAILYDGMAHIAFLDTFKVSSERYPLVVFDRGNMREPFRRVA